MAEPKPHDEALKSLDARLDALAKSSKRQPRRFDVEGSAGAGYRMIAELIGGMAVGLGLGWVLDRIAGTSPFGLIGGVLVGTGISIFAVVRSAGRMSKAAEAPRASSTPGALAEEDDNGPGSTGVNG